DIVLTLGDAGEPAHVEITSRPDGPLLAMSLDISVSGEVLSIARGGDQPTSITGDVSAEQVEAAGIFHAVELGEVPDFWILYRIELRPESPTSACSSLSLAYQHAFPATPSEQYVTLAVRSVDCPFPGGNLDEPITLGSFTGAASTRSGVFARVSDGRVAIEVSTDLPVEELDQLFASIEPFDPATRPEER
ncbi:MAG: hypothetical protein PV358_11410, partial [Acidimicrobiales bacterium]|nr:hypothetical protein [Acidimicrobiales bacterium]